MAALTPMPTLCFAFCITMRAADLTDQPAFSGQGDRAPDGPRIIYTRKRGNAFHQIYVMNMDGANPRNLSRRSQPHYNGNWSRGGSRIVFVSQSPWDNTTAALYTGHAEGSGIRKITDAETGCFQPRWSSDGTRIVFRLGWGKDHVGLFVRDFDGGHLVQITNRLK